MILIVNKKIEIFLVKIISIITYYKYNRYINIFNISYYIILLYQIMITNTNTNKNSDSDSDNHGHGHGSDSNFDKNTPLIDYLINKRINFCVLGPSSHIAAFIPVTNNSRYCFIRKWKGENDYG